MRVYRANYRTPKGQLREVAKWYVEFRDEEGVPQRLPAFTDKAASEELGRKIDKLVGLRSIHEAPTGELAKFLEELPRSLRKRFAKLGLLDARQISASRPITDLLGDFTATLRTRERTEDWIAHVVFRARVTFEGAGCVTLSDIDAGAIERHLHALRSGAVKPTDGALGRRLETRARRMAKAKKPETVPTVPSLGARESNHRLQSCKEFTRWALAAQLIGTDPLVGLAPVNAALDARHVRRALRPEEIQKLVSVAHNGPTYRGVPGEVRAMAWRLAAQVGLRVGEIQTLQVRHVDLESEGGPMLTVSASASKNRTEARVPIATELARDLAPWLREKLPSATVLPLPPSFRHKAALWLRVDLKAAEIPYCDESGRVADVHSLRSSFVAQLVRSGANVKAIQRLARHSSPMMTLGVYARLDARDEREAIDALPMFAPMDTTRDEARASGTGGGGGDLPRYLPSGVPGHGQSGPLGAPRSVRSDARKLHRASRMVAVEGFEPPTRGL